MAQQTFDPSSKWMLEEQGASILYLAGERSVLSCKARKAEVVQPCRPNLRVSIDLSPCAIRSSSPFRKYSIVFFQKTESTTRKNFRLQ